MLEVLGDRELFNRGGRSHIKLSFYIGKQMLNVDKAIDFYMSNGNFVNRSSILYRICDMVDYGDIPASTAYNYTRNELNQLCLMFGITTSTYSGEVQEGNFNFKEGELFVSTPIASYVDLVSTNWKNIKPLTLLYREGVNANLELFHPDSSKINGFGLFGIDLPAFTFMFYSWAKENNLKPEDSRESVQDFIHKHIVVPLIRDNMRLCYINMMQNDVSKEDVKKPNNVPFSILEQSDNIYYELNKVKEAHRQADVHPANFMSEYPAFDFEDIYSVYPNMGDDLQTSKNRWAYVLSSINIVHSVLNMTPRNNDKTMYLRFRVLDRSISSQRLLYKTPSDKLNKLLADKYKVVSDILKNLEKNN